MGDGQCTMGSIVIKPTAKKARRIGPGGTMLAGSTGATADAFSLLERLETKIEEHPGQLVRTSVSLAKVRSSPEEKYQVELSSTLCRLEELSNLCRYSRTGAWISICVRWTGG